MPTLRTVTVKSAGGDYSSTNAAFVGEVGNLVTLDRFLNIDCYNFADSTSADSGTGWTTDATRSVLVEAVDNHGGFFGGVGGTSAYSNTGTILLSVSFATLRGISATNGISTGAGAQSHVTCDRCIMKVTATFTFAFLLFASGGSHRAINCLTFLGSGSATGTAGFYAGSTTGLVLYACTSYGLETGFLGEVGSAIVAKDCAAISSTTTGFSAVPTWTGSANCASSDANVPTSGAGHRASQTISLINPSGGDYRLSPADAGCRTFGTSLVSDPTFPFSVDIKNDPRPTTWDIGAFQSAYVTVAGTLSSGTTETNIVAGGKVLTLTVVGDTWITS